MNGMEFVDVVPESGADSTGCAELIWRGTEHFRIDRFIHVCTCIDNGEAVQRHTILIRGKQRYLYRNRDRWYVKSKIR